MSGHAPGTPPSRELTFTCPICGAEVKMREEEAERTMTARCPKGHTFPLAKALS